MSLQANLAMANLAVGFVRRLGVRANNDSVVDSLSERDYLALLNCVTEVRERTASLCQGKGSDACRREGPAMVGRMTDIVKEMKCGNCQEQDTMAIAFLLRARVRPLDIMILNPLVDHTFVVIGRTRNSVDPDWVDNPRCIAGGSDESDPSTWGPDAVICDPWHDLGKVYPATELESKMYRGWGDRRYGGTLVPTSIYRVE